MNQKKRCGLSNYNWSEEIVAYLNEFYTWEMEPQDYEDEDYKDAEIGINEDYKETEVKVQGDSIEEVLSALKERIEEKIKEVTAQLYTK